MRRLVAVAALLMAGACGTAAPPDLGGLDLSGLPADYEEPQPTWAAEQQIHYGSDVIDTDRHDVGLLRRVPEGFYVASDGDDSLWFVTADGTQLAFTPSGAKAADTVLSEDARHVAWFDTAHGPKDEYGTPLWELVVADLQSGEELVRTSTGLGDTKSDDLADLYEDGTPSILGVDSSSVRWKSAGSQDTFAADLTSGEEQPTEYDPAVPPLFDLGMPAVSPGGQYVIDACCSTETTAWQIEPKKQLPLEIGHPFAWFAGWASDDTGVFTAMENDLQTGPATVVGCTFPKGTCRELGTLPESTWAISDGWKPVGLF